MSDQKLIRDAIIAILVAADPKSSTSISIKKWFHGEPPKSRIPAFPWGWVEWVNAAQDPPVTSKKEIRDTFWITVCDRHLDAEKAEDSIMEFYKAIEVVLSAHPTLNATVAACWISSGEKQKAFDGDYSVVGVRMVLNSRRRE